MPKYNPGDSIKITVGGKEYDTIITPDGVQRFIENPIVRWLLEQAKAGHGVDLNRIAIHFIPLAEKSFEIKRAYAEFNMMLGYSVSGFADLSTFQDMIIDNVVWGDG